MKMSRVDNQILSLNQNQNTYDLFEPTCPNQCGFICQVHEPLSLNIQSHSAEGTADEDNDNATFEQHDDGESR